MTMPNQTETIEELLALPRSERRDALEELIVAQFKTILLMTEDEELSVTESFFDLGFTSLLISEVKMQLENLLGCAISANVLFNSPTVERLVEHLAGEALMVLFEGRAAVGHAS